MRENLYGRVVKSMKQYVGIYFEQGRILDTGNVSIAGMKQMLNVYLVWIIDDFAKADHASGVEQHRYRNAPSIIWNEEITDQLSSPETAVVSYSVNLLRQRNPGKDRFELGSGSLNAPMNEEVRHRLCDSVNESSLARCIHVLFEDGKGTECCKRL